MALFNFWSSVVGCFPLYQNAELLLGLTKVNHQKEKKEKAERGGKGKEKNMGSTGGGSHTSTPVPDGYSVDMLSGEDVSDLSFTPSCDDSEHHRQANLPPAASKSPEDSPIVRMDEVRENDGGGGVSS